MKAIVWQGTNRVGVETVPDPTLLLPTDAIVRVTSTAICGSDLHLLDGVIPSMEKGDILGHEFMGEVVEVGRDVRRLKVGDRVVVPFNISCGVCDPCRRGLFSACDNSNPNHRMAEALYGGVSGGGLFGYSHMYGGYAGGQAQYVRVPFADVGPHKIESDLRDEQVLFLTDIFPTGYQAAENCGIVPGRDVVAVFGAGPVGQFAARSAQMLGAAHVIVIDRVPERLAMAEAAGCQVINYEQEDVLIALRESTGGRGPDHVIDAVGMEAHGHGPGALVDTAKQRLKLSFDRITALRWALLSCAKGGTVSLPGVYGGLIDKVPMGAAFAKGLTFKMGQTHTHRHIAPLLSRIEAGEIDPSFVITHRASLDEAPDLYKTFRDKQGGCIKVVLNPWG
ncbi:glutathione-dependent formaldehyde dehydrogenase [Deinococcus arenae]|uniref:Glutathione-dependent formaldehyde dehydrogenase n=1 Tax=Deinococcus arenae TaxID=1452751 RepID=A0A8H9LCB0_9DEIO|nr:MULTISPECIES: zinc-dependent alcohol dehydrogenase [Deinococcus]AWT34788.1 glutathione-dependent formaldehyde dehydrogenase [Deinococcus actinosclerus]GGM51393.1 glutathione-dependent formaldehyde dehydrogenase [Deinococcus arenae]